MRKKSTILAMIAAIGLIGFTATPALAIDNVRCSDGAGYTEIHNEKRHCFANAGYTGLYITNVYQVSAGNNNITFWYRLNSNTLTYAQLNKGSAPKRFSPRVTVEALQIH
ncbi:beta/gamma crystallin domain-containing protein [Nonomuraea sp. SBT364]|uniref:beta/gamma crystallin domain-containing protein n=1 Tax=Nonomuraea sp. SBT364 TaxID=1580530 RepID=UPI00066ED318|nr:beta/gamma crystallin domain-containing protein [Nonomuraea sp. SBT364]